MGGSYHAKHTRYLWEVNLIQKTLRVHSLSQGTVILADTAATGTDKKHILTSREQNLANYVKNCTLNFLSRPLKLRKWIYFLHLHQIKSNQKKDRKRQRKDRRENNGK